MCGQYYVINKQGIKTDQKPTQKIKALTYNGQFIYQELSWGMKQKNKPIINARIETLHEKPLFKNTFPCIILANGYYEWDETKIKHNIALKKGILYMAGVYNKLGEFVIVTTPSHDKIKSIHERMPLILNKQQAQLWLTQCHRIDFKSIQPNDIKVESQFEQCILNM